MIQFSRLRLTGFKSFVDPTELDILPGLTGIVGPNGCGKSNLVEALRWAMGETSAKKMRGGEMDDVIFGGTANRPPRNLAEVAIHMDNRARTAPASLNDDEELEVVRRIERGQGSLYKVNGRDVRARDIHLMFADLASGPRSTAIVSQGRVSAIIAAKPVERRALLEEAAGITGLHTRRHEAELRLRAAETNLQRLEDVLTTLEAQLQSLKKQARQANRYRTISDQIRRTEAGLLHLRWTAAREAVALAEANMAQAESMVSDRTRFAARAATAVAEAQAVLPGLRQKEAEVAAELHRLVVERDGLEAEEARVVAAIAGLDERLGQIAADTQREQALASDAHSALAALADERQSLAMASEQTEGMRRAAAALCEELTQSVTTREARLSQLSDDLLAVESNEAARRREVEALGERRRQLHDRLSSVTEEHGRLSEEAAGNGAVSAAQAALQDAQMRLDTARAAAEAAEAERALSREAESQARSAAEEMRNACDKLHGERAALEDMVVAMPDSADPRWKPIIDQVDVAPGLEKALGAVLGDDLVAPGDSDAPTHWRALPALDPAPALPASVEPLSDHVRAPALLARRLSQIGLAPDNVTAAMLAPQLLPGQRLVTLDGGVWRWDGFTVAPGTPTAAATRLHQRNRLEKLKGRIGQAESVLAEAEAQYTAAQARDTAAAEAERAARQAMQEAFATRDRARDVHAELDHKLTASRTLLTAVAGTLERLHSELADVEARLDELDNAPVDPAAIVARREEIALVRAGLADCRTAYMEARGNADRLEREAAARLDRFRAMESEEALWRERAAGAAGRLAELATRRHATSDERSRLQAEPRRIAERRGRLAELISAAEIRRRDAGDALATAESTLNRLVAAQRDADSALSQAREDRVRAEADVSRTGQEQRTIEERVAERLECQPEDTLALSGLADDGAQADPDAIETRLNRLLRERENLGAVNLRAQQEAEELDNQISQTHGERDDLVAAIGRLRQGISSLNREGRERLLASFETVNTHFQTLFQRLFGGGRAYLELTEADDPLEAGLEIFASPPGKRLQRLSLLSGGEQALTAIALLFAVFLTNPAPVCVLDEVDAPLDDANVDRFCTLLAEIAHQAATRFLIITHHRLTMARMDRLFGVTMIERGISQLVSVDLQGVRELRGAA
ncbi:MAG: chromosome segregation protein SMC [Alphaproteobacteria bacterium]